MTISKADADLQRTHQETSSNGVVTDNGNGKKSYSQASSPFSHQGHVRLRYRRLGVTVTETITTSTATTTKVELDNVLADGLKADILTAFSPKDGFSKGQKLSLYFKQGPLHLRGFGDLVPSKEGGATNIAAAVDGVFAHEGFLVGGEAAYDVQKATLTRYALALGYQNGPFSGAVTGTNNLSVFTASIYQKVKPTVEAGIRAAYDTKNGSSIGLEMAAKYKVDALSFAKVRTERRLSIRWKVQRCFAASLGQIACLRGDKVFSMQRYGT